MTITLCIETSGPHCSLALAVGEQIYERQRLLQRSHNQHLLMMLDELFAMASLKPTAVELMGFGCGPGSFTGVRIAATATQAIAFAAGASVVPVPSSQVLALTAAVQQMEKKFWLCCIPSRGQAFYVSAYRRLAGMAASDLSVDLVHAEELVESPPDWLDEVAGELDSKAEPLGWQDFAVVGTVPSWLPVAMRPAIATVVLPSARAMIGFVRQAHARGGSLAAEHALPSYVAGDSPWHKQKTGQ